MCVNTTPLTAVLFAVITVSLSSCAVFNDKVTFVNGNPVEMSKNSALSHAVKKEIDADPTLRKFDISVESFEGIVHLGGSVSSKQDIEKAAEIASRVSGVHKLVNSLELKSL